MPILRSTVSWVSASSAAIAAARTILRECGPSDVLDELGFRVLTSAFSEQLYPATNTLMGRARYLIFVPAIYWHMEHSRVAAGRSADSLARSLQSGLCLILRETEGPGVGVIGEEKGEDLLRVPSNIYWTALGELGFAVERVSENAYQDRLEQGQRKERLRRDDDGNVTQEDSPSLWSPEFRWGDLTRKGAFPPDTTLRLTRTEAELLERRYAALCPEGHDSLLTRLVGIGKRHGPEAVGAIEEPWDVPDLDGQLRKIVDHARRLSLFGRGVVLQFHRMVVHARGDNDPGAARAFEGWWLVARRELVEWPLDEFLGLLKRWGTARPGRDDAGFVRGWSDRCRALSSAEEMLWDREAQRLVRRREEETHAGRERLRPGPYQEEWEAPKGDFYSPSNVFAFDFRHFVGRRIATDIVRGLREKA